MTNFLKKLKIEPLFHISKRVDVPRWKRWFVRICTILGALLLCGIISSVLKPGSFEAFFNEMFSGTFGTPRRIINLLQETAILLCIALAVTPAFKMKFWNIGAEGQALMGALLCAACMRSMGGKVDDSLIIVVALIASIAGGALWGVVPALFKAKWNTNETLFTLMMNYIAMGLIAFIITVWVPSGSGVVGIIPHGHFPRVGQYPYILNIIVVAVLTVLVYVYLRFSKHGYELTVVGESVNTAKYIGINVKKVIIRTMILSGALCGIAGWLLVGGTSYTISTSIVAGRGFTAILISWLAHFNPIAMAVTSFMVAFLKQGSMQAASTFDFGGSFPNIITAVFFFLVIASEFFIGYKIKFRSRKHADGEEIQPSKLEKCDIAITEFFDKLEQKIAGFFTLRRVKAPLENHFDDTEIELPADEIVDVLDDSSDEDSNNVVEPTDENENDVTTITDTEVQE